MFKKLLQCVCCCCLSTKLLLLLLGFSADVIVGWSADAVIIFSMLLLLCVCGVIFKHKIVYI